MERPIDVSRSIEESLEEAAAVEENEDLPELAVGAELGRLSTASEKGPATCWVAALASAMFRVEWQRAAAADR